MSKIKYHVSVDGNARGLFDSEKEAEKCILVEYIGWSEEKFNENYEFLKRSGEELWDSRRCFNWYEVELSDDGNAVLTIDGLSFGEYIEDTCILRDMTSEDFDRIRDYWLCRTAGEHERKRKRG